MRRKAALVLTLVMLVAGLWSSVPGATSDAPSPAEVGQWSAAFAENSVFADRPPATVEESKQTPPAVTMVVLPDGRILYWGGLEGLEDSAAPLALDAGRSAKLSRSRVLDLSGPAPAFSTPSPETGGQDDMFCADQRLLPNGKVLAAGGTVWGNDPVDLTPHTGHEHGPGGTAELFGSKAARLFDPASQTWTPIDEMGYGRWYPTMVTMPDGRQFVASGVERLLYNDKGTNVHNTEIFDPATGSWSDNGSIGATSLPLFARMHLLPDGRIFYNGSGQMWSPFGQAYDEAEWNLYKTYDPQTNSWEISGAGAFGARSGNFSVMLPLRAPYDTAKILVAGGTLGTSPGSYLAGNLTEVITASNGSVSSQIGPMLNNRRWYSSGVLLPDGTVVALSGADKDEVIAPGTESPVRQAELFDGQKWIPLSSGSRDRTYHNAAVLLADGSILVGGHSPINSLYGPKGDPSTQGSGLFANNLKDPSFEIFRPPYLFRGPRPEIAGVQSGIAWGSSFSVSSPQAQDVEKVVLVRLPSTTHVTDADMRAVELTFSASAGTISASAPPNGKVAPPGYYYLFVMSDNGQGLTPSKARIVKVGATADLAPAPAPMGT